MTEATDRDLPLTLEVRPTRDVPLGRLPLIDARQLFCQGNTIGIEHDGQRYQLRITRENKLILTK